MTTQVARRRATLSSTNQIILFDSGRLRLGRILVKGSFPELDGNCTFHLFGNSFIPESANTLADFVELALPGYSAVPLVGALDQGLDGNDSDTWQWPEVVITAASTPPVPVIAFGYYVTHDPDDCLLWGQLFDVPCVFELAGDDLRLQPQLSLGSCCNTTSPGGFQLFEVDTLLSAGITQTFAIDGLLAHQSATFFTVDAELRGRYLRPFTVDTVLGSPQTQTFTVDALLAGRAAKTFTADALLASRATKTFTVDSFLEQVTQVQFTADALLANQYTPSFAIDSLTAQVHITSFSADSALLAHQTWAFTVDTVLAAPFTKTFTVDASLLAHVSKAFTVSAVVAAVGTRPFTVDALLASRSTKTFTADALLASRPTKTFTVDADVATLLLYDTFQDTTGTLLSAHTPNKGPGWTVVVYSGAGSASDLSIQSNALENTNNSVVSVVIGYMSAGQASATARITFELTSATAGTLGIMGRITNANNQFKIVLAGGVFQLIRVSGGSGTLLQSAAISGLATGTIYTMTVVFNGNTIDCQLSGPGITTTNLPTTTDSTFNAVQNWGVVIQRQTTVVPRTIIHSFEVWK